MKRFIGGTLVVLLSLQVPLRADEHLVSETTMQARLIAAATDRAASIAVLEALLDAPQAVQAAKASGVSVSRLKGQLPLLSDEELRDLSRRAAELEADPVAGMSTAEGVVLIVIVAFLILVVVVVPKF